ncbi:MarR family winged helix-turn-helix transcriptional regulator [Companilactobacillus sp. DQM5]|uniref:MarR family winged helix-turn-helix transcriptional regulator n=1 Tax=Companilactobacillus sp. DQM5 TaxID=3463359 RepID=UPI0040586022
MIKKYNYLELNNWYKDQNFLKNKLNQITLKNGLTFSQFSVLLCITEAEISTPTDITNELHTSRSSISRTIRGLQQRELVAKIYGTDNDQRKIILQVTKKGSEVLDKTKKDLNQFSF